MFKSEIKTVLFSRLFRCPTYFIYKKYHVFIRLNLCVNVVVFITVIILDCTLFSIVH